MNNEINDALRKIEIPKELHDRVILGAKQVKLENRKRRKKLKWVIIAVASVLIIGATLTIGHSKIADATNTYFNQIYGSKEKFKQEVYKAQDGDIKKIEDHFDIMSKLLTKEEMADYIKLCKERENLSKKLWVVKNGKIIGEIEPSALSKEDQKRFDETGKELQKYDDKLRPLYLFTLDGAQKLVNYPILRPKYIPEGFKLIREEARTELDHLGKDPVTFITYSNEKSFIEISQYKIGQKEVINMEPFIESYKLHNFNIDIYSNGNTDKYMRLTVQDKGYKVTLSSHGLTKEEMEKILLSMVEQ